LSLSFSDAFWTPLASSVPKRTTIHALMKSIYNWHGLLAMALVVIVSSCLLVVLFAQHSVIEPSTDLPSSSSFLELDEEIVITWRRQPAHMAYLRSTGAISVS